MPAFLSNNTCNEYLASGQSAWGSQFIPNIQSAYVAKKAGNSYWFPPVANVSLFPNLTGPGPQRRQGAPGHQLRDQPRHGLEDR